MSKILKKTVSLTIAAAMMLLSLPAIAAGNKTADWALYVYMCGSNLESDDGSSTKDILEMLDADIPDSVKVIVMTGGASRWDPKGYGDD